MTVGTLGPVSTERLATNELRAQLGRRIDNAHFKGEHVIVDKNGEPRAVLVPYDWWQDKQDQASAGLTPP
ncbi:hypothetical protein GCM10009546_27300 [Actinomadura livida]|uniref:Antitoxin n=1 Tax=Actinomadura livida TaxID=79909 RepID=A0ABN1EC58_9ACTN|nr:hypothetical protein GCM10010208_36570 [Actinomadura livida]